MALTEPRHKEIFHGWWVVLAAAVGLLLHYAPVIAYTFGVFMKPLSQEFGWGRAELSLAFSLASLGLAGAAPFVGILVDRCGARQVIMLSVLTFGLCVSSCYFLSASLWHLYALYLVIGVVGAGTSQVGYSKVVSQWFTKKRGMALALAGTGTALGGFILPPAAQALITAVGWRSAYALLGFVVIGVVIPVIRLFLTETPRTMGLSLDGEMNPSLSGAKSDSQGLGMSGREVWYSGTFWLIVSALFLLSVGFNGCLIHLVPMLTDRGISAQSAALAASLLAGGVMIGRLVAGYLLDRFFAPYIAVGLFGVATLGIALLWSGAVGSLAFGAAALLGLGMGAETDILPYIVSRYFGLRAFGEIYGYTIAALVLGGVIGPLLMGVGFDATGSYQAVLGVFMVTTLFAAGLMARLGPYRAFETEPQSR